MKENSSEPSVSKLSWMDYSWEEMARMPDLRHVLPILPIHGIMDHGLGLPLSSEETLGGALLELSLGELPPKVPALLLPPLRFALAPYPHSFFGINADTAHNIIYQIAQGIANAGMNNLVLFNTNPWNEELVISAARDVRLKTGLQTFIINACKLAGFHPASDHRSRIQTLVSKLSGKTPDPVSHDAFIYDEDFRPGAYMEPGAVESKTAENVREESALDFLASARQRIASVLCEMTDHGPSKLHASVPREPRKLDPDYFSEFQKRHFSESALEKCQILNLTREEIEELPAKENVLIILPTAAVEQHGHHLPLGTDFMLNNTLLGRALEKLNKDSRVLVAPPLIVGKSTEHTGFQGTLSISSESLRQLILATASQLHKWGFRQLAVFNSHGGNSPTIVHTLRELQTHPIHPMRAGMLSGYYKAKQNAQESAFGFHAGEWETALMLASPYRHLVNMDKAVCEYPAKIDDPGELRPESSIATFSWMTRDISQSGVMGDATKATEEQGRIWLEDASCGLASMIEKLANRQ